MHTPKLLLVAVTLLGASMTADAATVISEKESGTIAGNVTVDTYGIFGPAGADLAGKAISIYYQYAPADFGALQVCRNNSCTLAESEGLPTTPGATLISVNVNGKRVTFYSSEYGEVLFDNGGENYFYIYANTSDFGLGYNGMRLVTSFTTPPTFGSQLSPGNPPVLGTPIDFFDIYAASDDLPLETLTFELSKAAE